MALLRAKGLVAGSLSERARPARRTLETKIRSAFEHKAEPDLSNPFDFTESDTVNESPVAPPRLTRFPRHRCLPGRLPKPASAFIAARRMSSAEVEAR